MSLSIGIVGLPNVGKSTLFNALLKSELAEAANYAFTTIEPNVGIVDVPDERLAKLAEIEKSGRIVPATVKFVDIAGLIAGAHKGEGLGNKFLAHIREVDAIAMVIRVFENKDVVHVAGEINSKSDIETIKTELILSDAETLEKKRHAGEKEERSGQKEAIARATVYNKIEAGFEAEKLISEIGLTHEEMALVKEANFLTIKPFVYIFNVNEDKAGETPEDLIGELGLEGVIDPASAVVISAKIEQELSQMPEVDQAEFLADLGLEEPGLYRLVKAAYQTLNLISFFTAGEMEARAWTITRGDKAPQAAGKIHTDFEKKFIKAEVVSYDDFIENNGWGGVKGTGKVRLEGKEYVVKDGDIIFIFHGK